MPGYVECEGWWKVGFLNWETRIMRLAAMLKGAFQKFLGRPKEAPNWWVSANLKELLWYLDHPINERKLRLFACALCLARL
jgi:hypothetical protein